MIRITLAIVTFLSIGCAISHKSTSVINPDKVEIGDTLTVTTPLSLWPRNSAGTERILYDFEIEIISRDQVIEPGATFRVESIDRTSPIEALASMFLPVDSLVSTTLAGVLNHKGREIQSVSFQYKGLRPFPFTRE